MNRLPIVEVRWLDSKVGRSDWKTRKAYRLRGSLECRSVGYLLSDRDGIVTLVQSLDRGYVSGSVHIPKVAVLSVRRLSSGGETG